MSNGEVILNIVALLVFAFGLYLMYLLVKPPGGK